MNPSARRPMVRRFSRVVAVLTGLAALAGAATVLPARAQLPSVTVAINPIIPPGLTDATLPVGPQVVNVVISNTSTTVLVNQQLVIRAGLAPAYIVTVIDGTASLGKVESGVWYGLVPAVPANSALTLTMTWFQPCTGRWPVAARFGDRTATRVLGFVGAPDPKCPPDETVSPQPAAYYALPWPPSTVPGATTPTPTLGGTTTTLPGATTTAIPGAVATTIISGIPTLPGAIPTAPGAATSTTLLRLGPSTTALVTPVQPGATTTTLPRASTTAVKKKTGPTTTTIIICKTVAGRRYCGPSSSAYKPGQKKVIESKPGQKVAVTTKKKK